MASKWRESGCGLNFNVDTTAALLLLLVLLSLLLGSVTEARVASGKSFMMEEGFHKLTVPSNNPPASIPLLVTLLPSIPEEAPEAVDQAMLPNRVEVLSDPSRVGELLAPSLVMLRS